MWVLLLKPASFLPSAFVLLGQNYHSSQQKDPTWNEPRKCLSWGPAGADGHCRIVRMDRLSLAPPMLRHLHIWLLLPGGEHIDAKPMAGPLLWCTQYWKESTRFIWNTVVSFHSVVFFNFLLLGPISLFLRQLHFKLNPSLEPAPPLSSIKQSSFQVPPPVSFCVNGSPVLPTIPYKSQLFQIVVILNWSMVLGHLPHSQCPIPNTIPNMEHLDQAWYSQPAFRPQLQPLTSFPLSQGLCVQKALHISQ